MPVMKLYAVGGLMLLLVSPFWILAVPYPRGTDESLWVFNGRMQADDWGRWLGVLGVVLGVLQVYVALSRTFKIAVGLFFIAGSWLISYGLVRGFSRGWGFDVVYLVGIALVGSSLFANLLGVLRFPRKAST